MTIIEFWDELGIDKDEVSARFVGNMDLAAKCTMKYIDDNTFNELQTAMAEQNYSGIEIAAHTLKGVAGNLGFSEIRKSDREWWIMLEPIFMIVWMKILKNLRLNRKKFVSWQNSCSV